MQLNRVGAAPRGVALGTKGSVALPVPQGQAAWGGSCGLGSHWERPTANKSQKGQRSPALRCLRCLAHHEGVGGEGWAGSGDGVEPSSRAPALPKPTASSCSLPLPQPSRAQAVFWQHQQGIGQAGGQRRAAEPRGAPASCQHQGTRAGSSSCPQLPRHVQHRLFMGRQRTLPQSLSLITAALGTRESTSVRPAGRWGCSIAAALPSLPGCSTGSLAPLQANTGPWRGPGHPGGPGQEGGSLQGCACWRGQSGPARLPAPSLSLTQVGWHLTPPGHAEHLHPSLCAHCAPNTTATKSPEKRGTLPPEGTCQACGHSSTRAQRLQQGHGCAQTARATRPQQLCPC